LFIYIGRRFDALKILYWDKNGFALWWKKIESDEKYHWPRLLQQDVVTSTVEQLNWLLEGYDIWTQPHRMIKFAHVS
jgi:transposase